MASKAMSKLKEGFVFEKEVNLLQWSVKKIKQAGKAFIRNREGPIAYDDELLNQKEVEKGENPKLYKEMLMRVDG